tara:strand:- start:270 stop:617 length:348 start_codon:yes stop_codon:yes gene_type:complete
MGGISTVTTTSLQYKGLIDHWEPIVISSAITFFAILGCVLRCACKVETRVPNNNNSHNTIIIIPGNKEEEAIEEHTAIPIIENTVPVVKVELTDKNDSHNFSQKIHKEWRKSLEI